MIQHYSDPQGKKVKTVLIKWENISIDILLESFKNNSMDKNNYLNEIAKSCLQIYNRENNTELSSNILLLFGLDKVYKADKNYYIETSFYLPADGYKGIIFDEKWVVLWVEKVAHKLAKEKSFEEYIKGFESRYPVDLLEKMNQTWKNFI